MYSMLKEANPEIYQIILESETPEIARARLLLYLSQREMCLEGQKRELNPLKLTLIKYAINVLRNISDPENERLSSFSALKALWRIIHGKEVEGITPGFIEEFRHIFLGISDYPGIYEGEPPLYLSLEGREAAVERSRHLDKLAEKAFGFMKRYPSGLEEWVKGVRGENKARIMAYFGASSADWQDYRWHLRHVITDSKTLGGLIDLTGDEIEAIDLAGKNHIPFGITPYYASLLDKSADRTYDHATRAQVIPTKYYIQEMIAGREKHETYFDFMLEHDTSPVDLIIRRYPMIVILKPYNTCAQICTYCQRNWEIEGVLSPGALARRDKLDKAIDWIREHPAIIEVLVTGGDPVIMGDNKIKYILDELSKIDHVERIRLGTRTPVVLPQRITDELVALIAGYHQPGRREVCVVTHFAHVYEITEDTVEVVRKLRQQGIGLYNQGVYSVENSRKFESAALRRLLRLIGVDPYYTFNMKGKEELNKMRVPIARLQQEQQEETRLLPGMVRTDEAVYNLPKWGKHYLRSWQHHRIIGFLPNGRRVYRFHPWDQNISPTSTYVGIDVSIYDYLQELKKRGEDLEDYKSIWYYY